jgi:hypothetical protein
MGYGPAVPRLLAACAGFLLAVLWMDLMFDVQALGGPAVLPDPVLHSISAYYARVTTEASPMGAAIGTVMIVAVTGALVRLVREPASRGLHALALGLIAAPVALALLRVFPDAVRLGTGAGPAPVRSDLARAILHGHLFCLVSVAAFLIVQLRDWRR